MALHDRSKRQQLPEEVATYVREMIISGEARAGEFLRIERIADAVGVSTTPVREGLLMLRSEGFVEMVPRRGFVVAPFTKQDVRDLFWAQAQLAGELTARAAKNLTPAQLDALEAILISLEKAIEADDKDKIAQLGHSFHREINLAAESPRLARLLQTVTTNLPNRFYATIEGHVTTTREEHPAILEALRKRSSKKARQLMEAHILDGADHLIELLDERGLWSGQQDVEAG
ncbi:GntR family transcriptional regulator [Gordonia sp. zg691]|uniref:GntR family transcriptional regulator n=1 Tax=Gordonia jinghuaiqii TaxID=2758710 RepID=A0A7D7LRY1_9ACTN|nr:GntR family transcriptional regulator [Gordonia jinghuaiqii]MBD0863135.1 GntR family transcriptional regulator [Gordonia jinghuaiqii]MCR5980354.1 FCD domain-containing protein [Gordonia jinghuaiqii]QMT01905.1 GntR family transcriptional regulator [Gordonia jinghuaiqii]